MHTHFGEENDELGEVVRRHRTALGNASKPTTTAAAAAAASTLTT